MTTIYDSARDPNGKYYTDVLLAAEILLEVRAVRAAIRALADLYRDDALRDYLDEDGESSRIQWNIVHGSFADALDRLDAAGMLQKMAVFFDKCGDEARDAFWAPGVDLSVFNGEDLPWRTENDEECRPVNLDMLRALGFEI
ncbi:MAG: hypothetical protein AAGH43_07365 [Pseudomonadota bacterium]